MHLIRPMEQIIPVSICWLLTERQDRGGKDGSKATRKKLQQRSQRKSTDNNEQWFAGPRLSKIERGGGIWVFQYSHVHELL